MWNFTIFALFHNDLSRHHMVHCWMPFVMRHEYQFPTNFSPCALLLRSVDVPDVVFRPFHCFLWLDSSHILAKSHVISSHSTPYLKCQFLKRAEIMSNVWFMVVFFHIWYLNNTKCAVLFLLHSIILQAAGASADILAFLCRCRCLLRKLCVFFSSYMGSVSLIRIPDVCFWIYVSEWKEAYSVVPFRYIKRGQWK